MAARTSWNLLPRDLMEHQIAQIDLLMAMYPDKDEVIIESESEKLLESFRTSIGEGIPCPMEFDRAPTVAASLCRSFASNRRLDLDIEVPFFYTTLEPPLESSRAKIRIKQPVWMNKTETAKLNSAQASDYQDLWNGLSSIEEAITEYLANEQATHAEDLERQNYTTTSGPIVRAWFYFPSISTRSKRDDLIIHAPSYSLTGFLFAGKPGLLCLEGKSSDIDAYMKFIKTESWGDIPAHHKKVTERYREKEEVERVFSNMQEITESVGERRGARVNRGDMKAVESWLTERGFGNVLGKVLM